MKELKRYWMTTDGIREAPGVGAIVMWEDVRSLEEENRKLRNLLEGTLMLADQMPIKLTQEISQALEAANTKGPADVE